MTEKDENCVKNIKRTKNKQNIVKKNIKKQNLTKENKLIKGCQVAK